MTSQIRVDEITNRSGLGTVTIYDNGFEFTGVTTFTEDVDITGGLTIGGVLTYEDTTNIDSVGLITARAGIRVTGDSIHVESSEDRLLYLKSTDANAYLTFEDTDSSSGFANRVGTVSDGLYFSTGGGGERFRITSSGDVSIGGLASPRAKLDIEDAGTSKDVILRVSADDNNPYALVVANDTFNTTSHRGFAFWVGSDKVHHIEARTSTTNSENEIMVSAGDAITFRTNVSEERLSITAGGQSKFTVGTNKYVKIYAASHNDEADLGAGIAFSRPSDGADMLSGMFAHSNTGLGIAARDHITLLTGGTSNVSDTEERLRITSTGLVGIGTNSPSGKLNIFGSDSQLLNLVQDSGDLAIRLNDRGVGSAYIKVRDNTGGSLSFDTGGSERLRITSGGITEFLGSAIKMPVGTSDPGSAATGWAYYNSSNAQLRIYDGSTWGGLRFSTKGSQTNPASSSSDLSATGSLAQYYFAPDGGTAFQNYACGGLSNLGTIPSGGPSWVSSHSSLVMITKGQVGQTSQYVMSQGNYLKFISESISRTTNTPYIYWAVFDSGTLWGITRTRWTGATYSTWGSNHDWDTGEANPPSGTVNWDVWKTGSGTTGNTLSTGSYTVSNDSSLVRAVLPQQSHNNAGTAYGIHYKRTTSGEHYPWFNSSGNVTSNGYFNPSGTYNLGSDTRYVHYIYLADS